MKIEAFFVVYSAILFGAIKKATNAQMFLFVIRGVCYKS